MISKLYNGLYRITYKHPVYNSTGSATLVNKHLKDYLPKTILNPALDKIWVMDEYDFGMCYENNADTVQAYDYQFSIFAKYIYSQLALFSKQHNNAPMYTYLRDTCHRDIKFNGQFIYYWVLGVLGRKKMAHVDVSQAPD